METAARKRFNRRAFASLMAAFAGAGLPVTGVANHLLQFDPLTPERHAWMAAHNSLAFLFLAFALWHVALNRRALLNALRGRLTPIPALSREAALAAAVVTLTTSLAVGHVYLLRPEGHRRHANAVSAPQPNAIHPY
ncbi:MAG TPA: DUF4405 domain-containing protein [Armatimonadota bacterium]|jgi:hypothetical protein